MRRTYLFNSKLYYYFLHIILFFYVYSVQFVVIPFGIGTRVFMGIFGFFIFLQEILITKKCTFSKYYLRIYFALFLISIFSFFSLLYNGTNQTDFLFKYQVSIVTIIFASYFVTKLVSYKKTNEDDIPLMMKLFINVVVLQIIIALIMFAFLPFRDFLNNIQIASDHELKVIEETLEFRLVGFGSKFFGSGVINGFALILIGSIVKLQSASINVFKYSITFLFIFVFGMMMARTTLVGALLAFAIIFYPQKGSINQIKINLKFFLYLIFIPIAIVLFIFYFFPSAKESLELAFNFGFEIFVNYFESDSLESASTNQMKEMYIWPTSVKTYLIGDGMFADPMTGGYYMATDIGILRLIYYFGIFGLLSYLIFQFQIAYCASLRNYRYKKMFFVIFLYCIILNYKGFTDLFFLNILFFINNATANKFADEEDLIYNSISAK